MKIKLLLLLIAALAVEAASAQESCNALLRHGIFDRVRETAEISNNSTIQSAFCANYSKYKSDKLAGSGEADYGFGLFGASARLNKEQIESIGQVLCGSDFSDTAAQSLINKSSALVSAPAIDAWQECQRLHAHGLKVETSVNDEVTNVGVTIRYDKPPGVESFPFFDSIQVRPTGAFSCAGSLTDLRKGVRLAESSLSMLCERKVSPQPKMGLTKRNIYAPAASISVITGAGAIVRHFSELPAESPVPERGLGEIVASMLPESLFVKSYGAGWVLADGRAVAGTSYERFIGKNVPDMRGLFLRGKNNGRAEGGNPDGDLELGALQIGSLQKHVHPVEDPGHSHKDPTSSYVAGKLHLPVDASSAARYIDHSARTSTELTNVTVGEYGGTETRPANITVNYFVKVE